MLVYGPSGAGKKTRVLAVLREMFGPGVEKIKLETRTMKAGSSTLELTMLSSNYHIELTPSDAKHHDRVVVQDVIKEMASIHALDVSGAGGGAAGMFGKAADAAADPADAEAKAAAGAGRAKCRFKVLVLNEVDSLTKDAQHALRRTMEKYASSCRLVLIAQSTTKVIDPLKSRCLLVRVPSPTIGEITSVLQNICRKEGNLSLPDALAERIAVASDRNLRRAILSLEATKVAQFPFADAQQVAAPDWEVFVKSMARDIVQEQTPQRLLKTRTKLYELLTNCIPPDVIIRKLCKELLGSLDQDMKNDTIKLAAYYEHRIHSGSKPILHLEAFVAQFMAKYKQWSMQFMFDGF